MMTPEAKVKAKIKKIAAEYDVYLRSTVMTGYGNSGQLDFYSCVKGHYTGIEAKATAKSPFRPGQVAEIEAIRAAGGSALVIHADNLDELHTFFTERTR